MSVAKLWFTGIRADARYSEFASAFGRGSYRSLLLTREIGDALRFDVQAGTQRFASPLARENRARWITSNIDSYLGRHYFSGAGFTLYQGDSQNYYQWLLNLGYRF